MWQLYLFENYFPGNNLGAFFLIIVYVSRETYGLVDFILYNIVMDISILLNKR